jgi:hypothetical protein
VRMPSARASRLRSIWSSAASLSIENVHSYGYVMTRTRSCRSAPDQPSATGASSTGTAVVATTRPSSWAARKADVAA